LRANCAKPSDGLEPSTPSLPWKAGAAASAYVSLELPASVRFFLAPAGAYVDGERAEDDPKWLPNVCSCSKRRRSGRWQARRASWSNTVER
jgi:hypothetical protein